MASWESEIRIRIGNMGLWSAYAASLLIAALMTVGSVIGLLNPAQIYPSEGLRQTALANDVANLIIGLPIMLLSLGLTWRGKLVGPLLWPGALMFALYNYLAYAFVMPVTWMFLAYLLLVALSAYTTIAVAAGIDRQAVRSHLVGRVPARFSAGVLILLGAAMFLRVFLVLGTSLVGQGELPATELAVLLPDALLSPAWVIGGLMLWRREALGYSAGLALLFQTSMLFIGLIIVLFLQPVLTDAPFSLTDLIVVAVMGLVTFIPTALYLRGVVRADNERGDGGRPKPGAAGSGR